MPSKTLIETANRMRDIREAGRFAIDANPGRLNLESLHERLDRLLTDFREHRQRQMTDGKYRLIREHAVFLSPHEIELTAGDGTKSRLSAAAFIIATGSKPAIPSIPGLEDTPYWTSDDVVRMPRLPDRVAVLGSGAIGMECAHLFEGLGRRVTVIVRGERILGQFDADIAQAMSRESVERGIEILTGTELNRVTHDGATFHLEQKGGEPLEFDALVIATGRRPRTKGLGLQAIGIAMEDGRILIDDRTATSLPHVFAAGDCASPLPVVHLAVIQGQVAACNVHRLLDPGARASSVSEWRKESAMIGLFTEPQCVQIGLNEMQAHDHRIDFRIGRVDYFDQGKGMISGSRHGFLKVLVASADDRIIGAAGVGPQVVETSHLLQAAIHSGMTAGDYLKIPHYHPTLAEAWAEAVEDASMEADDGSDCP